MSVLGIRCSNKDYSYAILEGDKTNPVLIESNTISYPKGYSTQFRLKWLMQEFEDLHRKHNIISIAIKGAEGLAARGKAFVERLESESMAFLVGGINGVKNVKRKVKSSMSKDLGMKGKGHYLKTKLDTSPIPQFDSFSEKVREAILVGWSEL